MYDTHAMKIRAIGSTIITLLTIAGIGYALAQAAINYNTTPQGLFLFAVIAGPITILASIIVSIWAWTGYSRACAWQAKL